MPLFPVSLYLIHCVDVSFAQDHSFHELEIKCGLLQVVTVYVIVFVLVNTIFKV